VRSGNGITLAVAIALALTLIAVGTAAVLRRDAGAALPSLAFAALTEYRQYDIAVAEDDGMELLTDDKLSYAPAWSPDGSQVVFLRGEPDTWEECCGYGEVRIWLMDADGSNAHPLTDVLSAPAHPQWMPDGRSLVFLDHFSERQDGLFELDLASGEITEFLPNFTPDWPYGWSLSPDGTQVVSGDVVPRKIVIFDVADGSETVIADDVFGYGSGVQWSPDGRWLAMTALVRGVDDGGLWAWDLQEEEAVQVSATTWVNYAWVGPSRLLSCRDIGLGDSDEGLNAQLFVTELGGGAAQTSGVEGYDVLTNDGEGCIDEELSARLVR
jgi:dipeptidyl aminopeptidase/acylaminoacyl peptidase